MQEQDGDTEPAHHARRPMNAFLIFCKRHRSVVRDKYPNLENRSITKILGEWWANLDKEEKACYTGLAKQYKDAFFSANPDFKWYKLPAPPLRTLASRPRDPAGAPASPDREPDPGPDPDLEKTNNNSTKLDLNKKPRDPPYEEPKLSMFTPGKLADEAQMGGLSILLDAKTETSTPNPYYSPPALKFGSISSEYRSHNAIGRKPVTTREDNIRELQNALSETTKVFTEEFDENKARLYRHGDMFTHQHVIDQVVDKQYNKDDDYGYAKNWSDDERNTRSGRSCKGKRYQEFMAVGGLMVSKRIKRERERTPEDSYASCSWDGGSTRSEDSTPDDKKPPSPDDTLQTETKPEASEQDNNGNKTFKAADFDLDAKIAALPSLSLEKFQQRKRENKRRKKTINLKPKVLGSSHIVNSVANYESRREMAESWREREQVIGSQKRKPRKVSITRFEISSLVDPAASRKVSPEIKLASEAPCTAVQGMELAQAPRSADLFALATLAEVAANTSKIAEPVAFAPHTAHTPHTPHADFAPDHASTV